MTPVTTTVLSFATLFGIHAAAGAQVEPPPIYVGQDVCLTCHDDDQSQRPCSLEPIPKHDRTFKVLRKPEAAHIATLCGIADPPQRSRLCLSCHATAGDVGRRWTNDTFDLADGVQCEACHDPGSRHVAAAASTPRAPRDRILNTIRHADRARCDGCHLDRPSHVAVLKNGYRIPQAQSTYKTPVNLTPSPAGDRLYVTCEESDTLIVVDPGAGAVIAEIPVGRQPHDSAVTPDGERLYVTNRLSDTVTVIDTLSLEPLTDLLVGDAPHGVLTDAAGRSIFVLNTEDDSVSVLHASTDHPIRAEDYTDIKRLPAGRGPWSLAASPGRESICITNVRPNPSAFQTPPVSEITVIQASATAELAGGRPPSPVRHSQVESVSSRPSVPAANMLQGIAAVPGRDVVLFTLMRIKNLVPITRLAQGWNVTNGLGVLWPDGRVDQVLLDRPNDAFPDPMDVAVSPDGKHAIVTSGGADLIAIIDVSALLDTITSTPNAERDDILPNHLGVSERFVIKRVPVGRNPSGVTFAPDGSHAYVANALDDSISVIDTRDFTVAGTIALTANDPEDVTEIRRGQRLFHSAAGTFGQQFSCRSCHPDGHINGLAFDIEADGIGISPVDNRTLRGILDTAPFKWEGTNPSLAHQCGPRLAVFFTRIDPFTPDELAALVRYISTIRRPPNPNRHPDGLTLAQRRGKTIFERTTTRDGRVIPLERRCNTCHTGGYKSSSAVASVGTTMWLDGPVDIEVEDLHQIAGFGHLGLVYFHDTGTSTRAFDVPHLVNIYNSPPYLHNGSAPTLEEIWTRFNLYDEHGITSDMTRRQFNDLIAYLRAL